MAVGVGIYNLDSDEFAKIKSGKELYSESVTRLLNTAPGERPYDPLFGCPLKYLVFEKDPFYIARSAQYMIQLALERYETRLELLNIKTTIKNGTRKIILALTLKVKATQEVFTIETDVELSRSV
jgi:hypothetical protein